jgi:adiponectin receptor
MTYRRPVVYYAFLCEPFWQRFYGIILTPLCAIALCLPFMTFFHVWRKARVTLYILLALGPLVMGAHSAYLFGVHSATVTQLFAHIFLSYATYAIGVAIYASRFPEALYPGSFNIWVRAISHTFTLGHYLVD